MLFFRRLRRPLHLIEEAKRGRLDQIIFFFGAVDDTGALAGTGAADDRPTTRSKVYFRRLQNAVILISYSHLVS